jgi:hypothetical protein
MVSFTHRLIYRQEGTAGSLLLKGWVGQRVGLSAMKKEVSFALLGIERRFIGRAARSLITILAKLYQ